MRRRSGPSRTRPTTSTSTAPSSEPGAAPQAAARLPARPAPPAPGVPPTRGGTKGRLPARRSAIVSTEGLAALARRVELGDYLLLGQGADRANERERPSVLAAAFESVVGALHPDLGLEA